MSEWDRIEGFTEVQIDSIYWVTIFSHLAQVMKSWEELYLAIAISGDKILQNGDLFSRSGDPTRTFGDDQQNGDVQTNLDPKSRIGDEKGKWLLLSVFWWWNKSEPFCFLGYLSMQ